MRPSSGALVGPLDPPACAGARLLAAVASLWGRQAEVDAGRGEGLTSDEREELRRLRRENRRLEQGRGILKRAAAFFAGESETR